MKTKLFLISFLLIYHISLLIAQVPQGFNYQAIAKDGSGLDIINATMLVRISILSDTNGFYLSGTGNYLWEEEQVVTTNTFGLFTINVGKAGATKIQGSAASFNTINWSTMPLFIGTKIRYPVDWKILGASKLLTVPYSLLSKNLAGPVDKLAIAGTTPFLDEALFEVRNKDGRIVFAVYNEGVRIYVDDGIAGKALKGGFAIGGFDKAKGTVQNYLLVKPDTIRMWVDDTPGKALKGGFAIGGFDKAKGTSSEYLGVKSSAPEVINPAQPRVLWYPLKEAFMTGRVYVPNPDSVGFNSLATGFESRAIGNYSQALGYDAIARGINSTSIGLHSRTKGVNSYAFGTDARATGLDAYAFGTHARATGPQSFAIGSVGVDSLGKPTGSTIASGLGAFALGFGSVAKGQGAFTLGVSDTASGIYSTAMGLWTVAKGPFSTSMGVATKANGWISTATGVWTLVENDGSCAMANGFLTKAGSWAAAAFGDQTYAKGHTSFATGHSTTAEGQLSSTFGDLTKATGYASMAIGQGTTAQAYGSLVIGRYNNAEGNSDTWNFWDPALVIGNGTSSSGRSNAFTFYNSGIADFASFINLSTNSSFKQAIKVNNKEALWYDGAHFSWGYDATYNYFGRPVTIGGTDTSPSYTLNVNGTTNSSGGYFNVSDARWKKDLVPLINTLPLLAQINGYRFNWRNDEFPEMNFENGTQIGIIAQEVEKVFPELVRTDKNGYKAVSYEKLSVLLLQGMKEQQQQIESVGKENLQLRAELQSLKERMAQIEALLAK